ncbi:hypothetical protein [Nocardia sp. CC227C]|uniref:hypothetical protein n=1 Tax=Nocardia sp. CC227C TaxID=3044562 RepID=UPI00278BE320|nr:hypothetical protein [Nocardia sp. CC227C]
MPVLEVNSVLAESAFGGTPGRAATGLPTPADATESWLRAVALAGVGHYAAARTELARTRRRSRDPILRSLTLSTEASFLRQLGWHALAATLDGRAAGLVLPDADPADRGPDDHGPGHLEGGGDRALADAARHEAVCDALTGLAADALGTGRPELAARLLRRSRRHLDALPADYQPAWRPRIRLHWVSAETALCAPGAGLVAVPGPVADIPAAVDPALAHAEAALALAERSPSVRHRVKSGLLVAAATAAGGDVDRAREMAGNVAERSRIFGLLPLRWACAMLLSGLDSAGRGADEAAACAVLLAARGGRLRTAA